MPDVDNPKSVNGDRTSRYGTTRLRSSSLEPRPSQLRPSPELKRQSLKRPHTERQSSESSAPRSRPCAGKPQRPGKLGVTLALMAARPSA